MFTLSRALQAIGKATRGRSAGVALNWNTPVQFDPDLVQQLISQYDELGVRFDALMRRLDKMQPAAAERAVLQCANRLHELRHVEALKLYPVIAHGLSPDPIARRLFWQSRLVTLGLARRVLRRFDELGRAVHNRAEAWLAAGHVVTALSAYRRRNESTMYPLYVAVGRREAAKARVA